MTVSAKQARDPDAAGIVVQSLVDVCQLPLRRLGRNDVQLPGDQSIEGRRNVGGCLPIDETEQHHRAQDKCAGDDERRAKRGGAREIRQVHGG